MSALQNRVSFVSLGCAKNLVDSEVMIGKLGQAGWILVPEAAEADAIVINTCAFIDAAKAESTDTILQHAHEKKPGQQLIVAGCLSQRFGEELRSLVPEIDGVVGTGAYASIVEVLEEARAGRSPVRLESIAEPEHDFLPRLVTTPRATAYLKVAEGCDHPCTFCIIPQLRGKFRSRSRESILSEARALAAAGTKELILIAQDTSMYGRDRGEKRGGLARLLRELSDIDELQWIRLLYLYPATVDDELIDAMATLPKVAKYMDMPLQHAHPEMLRAMLRPSNGERYLEIIAEFRERVPGITMRSTFIVGFFTYSQEDGTPAAALGAQVPPEVQRARLLRLRDAQRLASERARQKRVGRVERVLVEESRALKRSDPIRGALGARAWVGRSMGEAPGVDGGVYFTGDATLGEFVDITLRGATAFDFYGDLFPQLAAV
ncbi:MAG: 30S ribosomal protein S12 methylthiotransferase RimO [Vulcanimicrobiaceae bacterium]